MILISNHQTEADPAVIALLLESTNTFIAENLVTKICFNYNYDYDVYIYISVLLTLSLVYSVMQIFVAGDRVITDPLCKPFSMGRC